MVGDDERQRIRDEQDRQAQEESYRIAKLMRDDPAFLTLQAMSLASFLGCTPERAEEIYRGWIARRLAE